MIPANNDNLQIDFQFEELPTNTFFLHISKDTVAGFADRLQAMDSGNLFLDFEH